MYNGFIFDEKGVFYILTAFFSFTENVSINFEQKNVKSLIMPQLLLESVINFPGIVSFNMQSKYVTIKSYLICIFL